MCVCMCVCGILWNYILPAYTEKELFQKLQIPFAEPLITHSHTHTHKLSVTGNYGNNDTLLLLWYMTVRWKIPNEEKSKT